MVAVMDVVIGNLLQRTSNQRENEDGTPNSLFKK
jgi:hypothetical protein